MDEYKEFAKELMDRVTNGLFKDEAERKDYEVFAAQCDRYRKELNKTVAKLMDPEKKLAEKGVPGKLGRALSAMMSAATSLLQDIACNDSVMLKYTSEMLRLRAEAIDKKHRAEPRRPNMASLN